MFETRVRALQKQLPPKTLLILSSPTDITYFAGFSFLVPTEREALMVISNTQATLLYAVFSPVTKQDFFSYVTGCYPSNLQDEARNLSSGQQTTVWFDPQTLFAGEYLSLTQVPELTVVAMNPAFIWQLRAIKDESEQAAIRKAGEITHRALTNCIEQLRAGMTEQEVCTLLEDALTAGGSGPVAFPTIVAFGEHSALPHHQPTTKKLEPNLPVLFDVGATVDGYCADMTRTIWFGDTPSQEFLQIESVVLRAYDAAKKVLLERKEQDSTLAKDIDSAARSTIANAGYGSQFIHTTGHGLGLAIHEQPSISSISTVEIVAGMVLTIEPGIYLEDKFGYRYENTVLVTASGLDELTTA